MTSTWGTKRQAMEDKIIDTSPEMWYNHVSKKEA